MIAAPFAQAQDHLIAVEFAIGMPWAAWLIVATIGVMRDAVRIMEREFEG